MASHLASHGEAITGSHAQVMDVGFERSGCETKGESKGSVAQEKEARVASLARREWAGESKERRTDAFTWSP